ncbi:MAG: DUF1667 domain-containing protein [Clostridia bacterium]|nr:DUF1667 domain-containing protein [Clostridia bacterium]
METVELVCIRCPMGCHLTVTKNDNGEILVSGNTCPRGEEYGKQETTNPMRTITTVYKTDFGTISLVTSKPIEKKFYFDVLDAIKNAPKPSKKIKVGDVFIKNILNSGKDIIVSGVHKKD